MMMLAGHPLSILQIGYLLVAVALVVGWRQWQADRRAAAGTALVTIAMLGIGAALAMVQLLPSLHLSAQTERAGFSYAEASDSSYAPYWAVTLLLPNFFAADGPAAYWAAGDPAETNLYLGLLPLALAALGVVRPCAEDRRMTLFLGAGALVTLLLAFGAFAWPYRLAYDLLPGFDRVRRPGNYVALTQFALALLAAYGVKALAELADDAERWRALASWIRRGVLLAGVAGGLVALGLVYAAGGPAHQPLVTVMNGLVIAGVVLLAVLAVLHGRLHGVVSTRTALLLLVLIVAVDLGSAFEGVVYRDDEAHPSSYIGRDWAGSPSDPAVPRLLAEQAAAAPGRFRFYPLGTTSVWANGSLVWGLESAAGYVVLCPVTYCDVLRPAMADPTSPLFDLLNIRYLLTGQPLEELQLGGDRSKFHLVQDGPPYIYENRASFPRAWVVHESIQVSPDESRDYVRAHAAELRERVVLTEPAPQADAPPLAAPGTVEITSYEHTRVDLRATMPAAGFVVLADIYYPGWEARVNGAPAHIYRANHAFRAVWLPAGEHEIEFRFHLPGLRTGAVISLIGGIAICGLIIAGLAQSRAARLRS